MMSMSREEQSRERERERQRKQREFQVSSSLNEREPQPVVFGVFKTKKVESSMVERILGNYDTFRLGQPATARPGQDAETSGSAPHLKPPHPTAASPSSSSSSKSSQPPQSSPSNPRQPKTQPGCIKPPHPPSTHAHTKNGEVKGNLKGGPGPGPGDGGPGGGGRKAAVNKAGLAPLKVDGAVPTDPKIQQIMSEMAPRDPVSAIVHTPRHDHPHRPAFPFGTASRVLPRLGKASESARSKQSQALDSGNHINDELVLSEDSDEEEQGNGTVGGGSGRPLAPGATFGTPTGHHQSSMGPASNSRVPVSPISSPKSSDDSSTTEDSSDDSEGRSSNNSTEEEPVECSPKHPENKSDAWRLDNFMTRKTSSPMFNRAEGAGQPRTEDQPPPEAKETLPPPPRERNDRKVVKNSSANGGHHGGRGGQEGRGWAKPDKAGLYEDSSDEGEPHPRPTPRVSAEVRQTPKHGRDQAGRGMRPPKTKPSVSQTYLDSDSDSDSPPPRKALPPPKAAVQDTDKSPKVSAAPPPREAPKKNPRKRSDSRKSSHSGAKTEGGRGRPRRPKGFQSQATVSDSDSDHSVDMAAAPDKDVGRGTPSRSARETPRSMASPLKAPSASPRASPRLPAPPGKAKRPGAPGLSASLGSDSPASKSEDEADSSGPVAAHRGKGGRDGSSKGALVSRAFGAAAKKDRASRDREVCDPKKKGKSEVRPLSAESRRDRSDKGVRGRAAAEASVAAAPAPAPSPAARACKSPVVSAEPKVPIPQVQFVDGVARLTCTIPLSFIDKVPKPSVSGAPPPGPGPGLGAKRAAKEEDDDEDEEEEEERKAVLDNRTKEGKGKGKGKRKACEPGTKATEDESKRKIISSIFGNVKRQDHESDDDKVKREVKKEEEEEESEEERGGRLPSSRPLKVKREVKKEEEEEESEEERGGRSSSRPVKVKREVKKEVEEESEEERGGRSSSRPVKVKREIKKEEEEEDSDDERGGRLSSTRPPVSVKQEPGEATPARQPVLASPRSPVSDTSISRQHRKKKQERSPPTGIRKRPKKGSERHTQESLGLPGGGSSNEGRGRRDGSVESEKWSRKRGHDRDSSLESTRSTSRANSECGENRSKKQRVSKSLGTPDAAASSPASSRAASQRSADDNHHAWPQEKDDPSQLKHPQRPQHSQQSSQDKAEESGHTPSGDSSGYVSRPVSEHESRASYRSSGEQSVKSADSGVAEASGAGQAENGCSLAAPHGRLPGPSTTPNTTASATLPPSRPAGDQALLHGHYANQQERQYASYFERRIPEINRDYNGYLNMAKQLKHIADEETDRSMQAMKYLEAALYFILSGKAMETDHDTSASLTMYKDTLNFIKWVSSVFRRENQEGSINAKLAVISLRCQSLLSLKIYQMRRFEHKDNQRQLNRYFQNHSKTANLETGSSNGQQWGGQRGGGSPSHPSQTPSPAGSVGSEGSQSSGYTTSTEGTRSKGGSAAPPVGHTPPHPQPPQGAHGAVSVPVNIHTLIMKQNYLSSQLASALDMWMEADEYVAKNNIKDFFDELDHQASPLTLHSSLPELVMYVQCGLHRIRA
ncbi:AF4/FMR2 family member 1-like isoform X3 [Eriocheir sinensis]|uniref:AF4/FMR2 family member 1-like isoform X3 n=1 Tax=Eriocheir sinensis TaxID=95602 RepID=UPI0021C88605|nr:AF4/FMR2 family member 1-like isoform X3 [Eriocheir sinensis]XP_050739871.1 AF4/FMR2 family member 1-like isoform X3 [Eriocheir sinensis]XP_050739872.1 AF4/FMR2 family member 1-like isoform X3 [Eriocheir sinensis]